MDDLCTFLQQRLAERQLLLDKQRAQANVRLELEFPPNWNPDTRAQLLQRRKVETLRHAEHAPTNSPARIVRDRQGRISVCPPSDIPTVTSQWTLLYDPSVPVYWRL
jgi:hypothetical protein